MYSNLYSKGKFVADGVFDPEKESKQCGDAQTSAEPRCIVVLRS